MGSLCGVLLVVWVRLTSLFPSPQEFEGLRRDCGEWVTGILRGAVLWEIVTILPQISSELH